MAVVMVIDDEPEVRQLLSAIIEREGHTVVAATDAADAWRQLDRKPDAMFVDIDMPGETGVEFVLRLREDAQYANIPVVFVTAYRERARPLQATGRGGVDVIDKPFRIEHITSMLKQLLSRTPEGGDNGPHTGEFAKLE